MNVFEKLSIAWLVVASMRWSTSSGQDQPTGLTDEDFQRGANLTEADQDTPDLKKLENPDMFQGDIAGMTKQKLLDIDRLIAGSVQASETVPVHKSATRSSRLRWPNAVVPYLISTSYTNTQRAVIAAAILEFHKQTCVTFVTRTDQTNYIFIKPEEGCWSYVGMQGGVQELSMVYGCFIKGVMIHEFLHALGFIHEHSRPDRDQSITVVYSNILPRLVDQFDKFPISLVMYLNTSYDYGSLMHYGPYAFAKNRRKPTIIPKQSGVEIGQRRGFSAVDIIRVRRLYDCSDTTSAISSSTLAKITTTTSTDPPLSTTSTTKPGLLNCRVSVLGKMRTLKDGCWQMYRRWMQYGIVSCDKGKVFHAETMREILLFIRSRESICLKVLGRLRGTCCLP